MFSYVYSIGILAHLFIIFYICKELKKTKPNLNIFSLNITAFCFSIMDWLEKHMLPCPSKQLFHIECPGCGSQRSLLELLRGNILESIKIYPALMPIAFLMVFAFLHLKFDFKNGATIIKWTMLFCAVIILISYIYKIFINHKIF